MSDDDRVKFLLANAVAHPLEGDDPGGAEGELRSRWLVRVIVSLLSDPCAHAAEERVLVERFVAPGLHAQR